MNAPENGEVESRARRMREMIKRLDVDMLELAYARVGKTYADAGETCRRCANTAQCLKWLAAASVGQTRPTFCPNLRRFEGFATR